MIERQCPMCGAVMVARDIAIDHHNVPVYVPWSRADAFVGVISDGSTATVKFACEHGCEVTGKTARHSSMSEAWHRLMVECTQ